MSAADDPELERLLREEEAIEAARIRSGRQRLHDTRWLDWPDAGAVLITHTEILAVDWAEANRLGIAFPYGRWEEIGDLFDWIREELAVVVLRGDVDALGATSDALELVAREPARPMTRRPEPGPWEEFTEKATLGLRAAGLEFAIVPATGLVADAWAAFNEHDLELTADDRRRLGPAVARLVAELEVVKADVPWPLSDL